MWPRIVIMSRGKLITIYGINNIGKTTQAKRLVERLNANGMKAKYVKYPVYDIEPTGPFLNSVLRGGEQKISEDELQLWFIMNRYQFQPELEKWLKEGYTVVAEDYVGTGIAWGEAKGLDRVWLEEANKFLLKEDLAVLFQGTRDLSSLEAGHVHEENEGLIEKCRVILEELADKFGWKRLKVQENWDDTTDLLWNLINN